MKVLINQNVNYANHTSSSAPGWNSSSAKTDSLSTIIRNQRIVLDDVLIIETKSVSEEKEHPVE